MSGTRIHSSNIGGGGSVDPNTLIGRSGEQAIGSGVTFVDVVFSTPMANTLYGGSVTIKNVTDPDPIKLIVTIEQKATTGFRASFEVATDTANYVLEYIVAGAV